jgi:ABC-2 type transport system ATP-binding protein
MGTLADMRHLSAVTVEVTFESDAPDLSAVDGVLSASSHGHHASLQVRGPMEPLLRVLAAAGVRQLRSREPSLEELFLTLYGGGDGATGDG